MSGGGEIAEQVSAGRTEIIEFDGVPIGIRTSGSLSDRGILRINYKEGPES
jgi:hypothetical protein